MNAVGESFNQGRLAVSSLHEIAFWEYGNPQGRAAVYLHGGPGAGGNAAMAEFFNPRTTRIILFDQRGCGQSHRMPSYPTIPHGRLSPTWKNCAVTWA